MSTASPSTTIQHVNVMVDNLDAATEFYRDVLGLTEAFTPDLGFPAQFFAVDEFQEIHVNQLDDVHPERSHFCLRFTDFDSVFRKALDLGILETGTWGKARRLPTGVVQAFVRDPSGNLIEISCEADVPVDPAIFELDVFEQPTA